LDKNMALYFWIEFFLSKQEAPKEGEVRRAAGERGGHSPRISSCGGKKPEEAPRRIAGRFREGVEFPGPHTGGKKEGMNRGKKL